MTFKHVNLNEVDPNFTPIPAGRYNLKIMSMRLREFTNSKTGEPFEKLEIVSMIVDDDQFSGRRIYDSLFADDRSIKACCRLMNATGIPQVGDFQDWLMTMSTENPTFNAPVLETKYINKEGQEVPTNRIDWLKVSPATTPEVPF